jgi:copper(I)-binding protein
MRLLFAVTLHAMTLAAGPVSAGPVYAVNEPWLRPAAAGATTELYVEITSSEAATLIGVRTDAAARLELLDPRGKVVQPFALPLPAGTMVRLSADAGRIRLATVARALKLGDRVAITLVARAADGSEQAIPVDADVRRRSPSADHHVPGK